MSERHLHAIVETIAAAGSEALARRAADGAAVPFDLIETPSPGSAAPLFSYRPRTRDFVEEQADALRQLAQWGPAVNVLAGYDGLGDYLVARGERQVPADARERADLVLRVMLAEMHAETGDFLHTDSRTEVAAGALSRCLLGGLVDTQVVVPLLGVRLGCERIAIGRGLELVRDDTIDGLPREARSSVPGRAGTLILVSALANPGEQVTVAAARPALRGLLTALRLYSDAAPALAPLAWTSVRGGGWAPQPFVGMCARATGTLEFTEGDAGPVRTFCTIVDGGRARIGGLAAWSLRRFELACERTDHAEALTDTLLGLRALLGGGSVGEPVGERLAVLCAQPDEQQRLAVRYDYAERFERDLMHGEQIDSRKVRAASLEMRAHLRTLLRDVVCGHLDEDVVLVADRLRGGDAAVVADPDVNSVDLTSDEPVGALPAGAEPAGEVQVSRGVAAVALVGQPTVGSPALFDGDGEHRVFPASQPLSAAPEEDPLCDLGDSIEFALTDLDLLDD